MAAFLYPPLAGVLHLYFRMMGWPLELHGAEHLPATGPAIVATNHVSHVDPVALGIAVRSALRRSMAFMAKRELFENPALRTLLHQVGAIEVDRGGRAEPSLEAAAARLRQGGLVAVFPEGTISTSFVPGIPRLGTARLAQATHAPIVPGAVWGGQRVMTKDRTRVAQRSVRLVVRFGPPLHGETGEDVRHLTARMWQAVSELVDVTARAYPDQPAGEHDRWWLPQHLGGTAPSVAEALDRAREEAHARRARRAAAKNSDSWC